MWPQLNYHKGQYDLWTCPKRFVYIPCGRQSGKTELSLRRLVRYLPIKKDWTNPTYFYAGPTYQQAKRTAWDRLIELIPRHWIKDISLSELTVKTVFGSELLVIGLDKPQRIEGLMMDGGVIDENSDIKPKTFDLSILPTLVWRDGWCWFTGVPKRFGVGAVEYREKYEAAISNNLPDTTGFSWPSEGIVPSDYLEICRQRMDVKDFDEQFNATWLTASGGVFYNFSREYNVRPCLYDKSLQIVVGMDFNVSPMAWILGHIKGDILEVFDEIWLRDTNTQEALNTMLQRYSMHRSGFEIYGDASSRGRHTSAYFTDYQQIVDNPVLKMMGRTIHFDKSNPPVADRFAETNARIQSGDGQRHLFIAERCEHLIRDLEIRAYKPGTREADDSDKDSGHPTDALGYVIHKRFPLLLQLQPSRNIVTIKQGAA